MNSQIVNGIKISYSVTGSGAHQIVFIHGNSSCKEAFVEQFKGLIFKNYQLIAVDLPGHGASDNALDAANTYTISGYAHLLRRLLTDLEISHPILVGWSLGGHIALEMVAQGYEASGVLITGTPPVGPGEECLTRGFLPFTFESAGSSENPTADEMKEYAQNLYGSLQTIPDQLYTTVQRTDGVAREVMGKDWIGASAGASHSELVGRFPIPITVIHGEDDPFVDGGYLKEISWQNLWNGKIACFPKCGHAPFIEYPAEFNDHLQKFASYCFEQTQGAHA